MSLSRLFRRHAGGSRRRRHPHRLTAERLEGRALLAAGQAVFNPTGGPQDWEIPAGVRSASITLVGSWGGNDGSGLNYNMAPARVQGTLAWPAGTSALFVWVGGQGANATGTDAPGAGGFNGGARGGTGSESSNAGGGGGGATDIRIGGYLPNTRVMVAGGSGGSGGTDQNGYAPEVGGNGGTGGAGTAVAGVWSAGNGNAGQGGDGGDGGAGGQVPSGQSTVGGSAGTLTANGGGGGGAGGYFGGYGGQAGTAGLFGTAGAGGGGGGGSSYADPTLVTNATASLAYNIYGASATINWVDIATVSIGPLQTDTVTQQQLVATFPDASFTPTWEVTSGALPAGLSLNSAGELSGTPTRSERYSFTVTVTAQPNAVATSTRTYTGSVTSQVPGAPTGVQGQAGYESVALTWTAPTNTGGEAITGYAVRYSTDGGWSWTVATANTLSSATSYTVTGLTSRYGYQFEVAAINGVGTGGWSAASATVFPQLDPTAPTDVVGTSGFQAVDLSWLAPSDTRVPITSYDASASVDGGSNWSAPVSTGSAAANFAFTGLTQGVPTIFRVRALGPNGAGPWSKPSAPVTPEQLPTAPTQVRGLPGDGLVTLSWTAPSDFGGGTLSGYKIERQVGENPAWQVQTADTGSTATTFVASGLANGTGYRFRVSAITQFGVGQASVPTGQIGPFTTPSAPLNMTAVAGDASATLAWQPPANDGGRLVSGYRIEAIGPGGTVVIAADTGTTATSYLATGLVNGQAYSFRVAAVNAAGAGPFSTLSNSIVPSAPSSVIAVQVLGDLVIAVSGEATAYFRTTAGRIEVAANRAFASAQRFDPATVTNVTVSGNMGLGGFVFTAGTLAADIETSGIGSIAFETNALATGTVQAALTTGPLIVSSAIRGSGGVTLDADVRLANDVEVDGGTGNVKFTGTVDGQSSGGQSLTVTALGTTIFEEAVGAAVPLESLETRATRPLVLSADTTQSRTIPLHYLPYTAPNGNVEDKYGIEVAIGNNPARMYEFDTGGTGFWAGYNPEWWQGVVPSANAALMENQYTSGNYFDGLATNAVLTLGSGSQKVSTGGAVQITAITAGGNDKTGATFDFSNASKPPIEGHFFGDFGASFGIAKPAGGQVDPPVQVTNPLLQLPGNLSSGFVVQLGPLGTSPRVVVGITDDLRAQFPTAIPLTEIDGLFYPNPNGAAFRRQAYEQFAFSGQYSLLRGGEQASLGTIQTLIDSGAPTMTIHYPDSTPPGSPFVVDGMVTSGTTFKGLFSDSMGVPLFDWKFVAGSEASVNAIAFTPSGSAASPGNSVNTGLNFYNGYDVMFDVATGYLRVRPTGGLSSVQLESVTTIGPQRYGQNAILSGTYATGGGEFFVDGATTLAGATTVAAGTGAVTFSGAVDSAAGGPQPLTVNSSAATRFIRPIGSVRPLASLTSDAGGSTSVVAVTTTGGQRFGDAATLAGIYTTNDAIFSVAGDATLAGAVTIQTSRANGSGSGGPIQFADRIDSRAETSFPLALDAGDDTITVTGIVGGSQPLGGIDIQSAKSAVFASAVHLDGSGFGAAADGLVVADQVTARLSKGGSIRRFTGSGVVFDKESKQSHLKGFEITDNVYDGIQLAAKSAGGTIDYEGTLIEGNAIHGNGAFGIEVVGPVRGLTIRDNTIGREGTRNPWDYVSGGPNTHGIVLAPGSYSGTVIKHNTIRFSRRSGIMMPGGVRGASISGNTIERNTAHGIEAATGDFSGTSIKGNTIRLNGGDGVSLGAGIGQGTTAGGNPQTGYSAAVGHYLVPFANSPNFYDTANPPADPQIAMQVGSKQLAVNLDTGSRGLYFDALQLDANIVLDGPKGHVFLNSSNRLYFGQWSNQQITFTQSSYVTSAGSDQSHKAQANVPVLVVTAIGASTTPAPGATVASTTFGTTVSSGSITITNGRLTRTVGIVPNVTGSGPAGIVTIPGGWWANYADNMLTATTSKLAPVANFGIGFDRSGQGTAPTTGSRNQLYNAFLNLTKMQNGSMRPGYVISATGVQLGLDSSVSGFASTDLAPTGLPRGTQSAPDWQPATGTVDYQGTTSGTGQIVIDMGISSGILTLPGKTPSSKFGGTMTVNLLNSNGAVQYGIDTSDAANLLNPTAVAFFNPLAGTYTENLPPQSSQFFNTGRKVFAAFDYLYDAAAGLLGIKVGSAANAQNAFASSGGQFTAAHFANPNAPAGVTNLRIGGDAARHGNAISANRGNGVTVNGPGSTGNEILSNSIFSNDGLGIDLANGGNASQPAPVLDSVVRLVGEKTLAVAGSLAATTGYSGHYRLQFFASPYADAQNPAAVEGRTLLGEITQAAGPFTATFARGTAFLGDWITVTATPIAGAANTSEFSDAVRTMTLVVDTAADAGTGSLRTAIGLANANPGMETIEFAIAPTASPATIALRSALPAITGGMTIDGRTQPVTVSGAAVRAAAHGFTVAAGAAQTTIRSLTISGFARGSGIFSAAPNGLVDGNRLASNWNGLSLAGAAGTIASGNAITSSRNWGIHATGGLEGARLESNTITGTVLVGVFLQKSTGIAVGGAGAGNVITGGLSRGLYSTGIYVTGISTGSRVQANTVSGNGSGVLLVGARGILVGGTTDADRNTITGNRGYGLFATGNSAGSIVQRNVITGNGRNVFTSRAK
jgi:hypothetical protein